MFYRIALLKFNQTVLYEKASVKVTLVFLKDFFFHKIKQVSFIRNYFCKTKLDCTLGNIFRKIKNKIKKKFRKTKFVNNL